MMIKSAAFNNDEKIIFGDKVIRFRTIMYEYCFFLTHL